MWSPQKLPVNSRSDSLRLAYLWAPRDAPWIYNNFCYDLLTKVKLLPNFNLPKELLTLRGISDLSSQEFSFRTRVCTVKKLLPCNLMLCKKNKTKNSLPFHTDVAESNCMWKKKCTKASADNGRVTEFSKRLCAEEKKKENHQQKLFGRTVEVSNL